MNTAQSAISTVLRINGLPAGKHSLVCRFMKGVFQQKPVLPRYNVKRDISIILNLLKSFFPVCSLDLQKSSEKLLLRCLILLGQQGQNIHLFDIRNMTLSYSHASFTVGDAVKSTAPGCHTGQAMFLAFTSRVRLSSYLWRYASRMGLPQVTLRCWAKNTLIKADVNINVFRPHSVYSAPASLAAASQLSLDTIMWAAGWCQESTFNKYYNLQVEPNFEQHVLLNA